MTNFFLNYFFFSIFKIRLIKAMTINEFYEDNSLYLKEICSHNGSPKYDEKTKTVICTCEEKYANEPREKYKKYINGQLIQCSYEKKRRFFAFFLAGICPLGLNYLYLGHYFFFSIIFAFGIIIFIFNIVSFILNYKINKKKEEIKRQQKIKKVNKKFIISNITEINNKCVNTFTRTTNILTGLLLFLWLYNFVMQGIGVYTDSNKVPTENDMGYLFETPEY